MNGTGGVKIAGEFSGIEKRLFDNVYLIITSFNVSGLRIFDKYNYGRKRARNDDKLFSYR